MDLTSKEISVVELNMGLSDFVIRAGGVFFGASEHRSIDLNGDGDRSDRAVLHRFQLPSGPAINLGLSVAGWHTTAGAEVFGVGVVEGSRDLNGDGDRDDIVAHVYDVPTGDFTNLGLAFVEAENDNRVTPGSFAAGTERAVLAVSELAQGGDLNGDGDDADRVVYIYDMSERTTRVVPVSVAWVFPPFRDHFPILAAEGIVEDPNQRRGVLGVLDAGSSTLTSLEIMARPSLFFSGRGTDPTGLLAFLAFEENLGDLNADGDSLDVVAHAYDLDSKSIANLGLAGEPVIDDWGRVLIYVRERSQGRDLNDDGDLGDIVVHLYDSTCTNANGIPDACEPEPSRLLLRGDCNNDGAVNIADATCILNWLFAGEADPGCIAATNTNGDDAANITDATYLLNYLFAGGPAPVAPFPECGPGMLPDELSCDNPPDC